MTPEEKLTALRCEIADLDRSLVRLLGQRLRLAARIGRLKKRLELPVVNHTLEKDITARHQRWANRMGVSPLLVKKIFQAVMAESVTLQKKIKRNS